MTDDRSSFAESLHSALFAQRVILVAGEVDDEKASEIAASLIALDALGGEPIEIRLNARSDSLEAAVSLIDTIDSLGVVVNATVAGAVAGTTVGVLGVCPQRRIGVCGQIELREPHNCYTGPASQIQRHAQALDARWNLYLHRLAEATNQPFEHLEADHRTGRFLNPDQAIAYGLIDEIIQPPLPHSRASS
jgi:ATP-dependent Clp protease protease subunit